MSGPIYGVGPPMPYPTLTLEEKQRIEEKEAKKQARKQAKKQAAKEAKMMKQKQKYDTQEVRKTVASFFRRRKKRQSVVFDHSRRKSIESADLITPINKTTLFPPNPNTNPLLQRLEARTEEHPMKESERRPFVLPPYPRDQRSRFSNASSPASRRSSNAEETESSLTKNSLKESTQRLSDTHSRKLRSYRTSVSKYGLESMNVASEAKQVSPPYSDDPFNNFAMAAPDDFPGSAEQLARFKASILKFESHSLQQHSSSSTLNEQLDGGQQGDLASNAAIDRTFNGTCGKPSEFPGGTVKDVPTALNNESLRQFEVGLVDTEDVEERRHRDIAYTAGQAGSGYH